MKNNKIKYQTTANSNLISKMKNSPYYRNDVTYHFITRGEPGTYNAYLIFEYRPESFHLIDDLLPTDEIAAAIIFRMVLIADLMKKKITYSNPGYNFYFLKYGSIQKIDSIFSLTITTMKRYVEIGSLPIGQNNTITDVPGVLVGHLTLRNGDINTGITAVLPHNGNIYRDKVLAGCHVFNGFGKSLGLMQIEELGTIETPILLTNTLSIGAVANGLILYMLAQNSEICNSTGTVNPLVLECNDGYLNKIRNITLTNADVITAIENADVLFPQGNVGAGMGMRCLGFKGGIGSASRIVKIKDKIYTLGVLVNSNFQGSSYQELKTKGRNIGELMKEKSAGAADQGSIIVVIATDLPLNPLQLNRVAKRAEIGIGNTGGYAAHGSGDIIVAFSVSNKYHHFSDNHLFLREVLHDDYLNLVFKATVEATEEAIINSMLHAQPLTGFLNRSVQSLSQYIELFDDLLIEG
ncbi:MAG: P1 family peptidase [Bacilli bacterium]|nr:P1 family peptidase [Bacilli bacterium]